MSGYEVKTKSHAYAAAIFGAASARVHITDSPVKIESLEIRGEWGKPVFTIRFDDPDAVLFDAVKAVYRKHRGTAAT